MIDFQKIEASFRETGDGKCAASTGGMVAAAHPLAARAGAGILARGGNAVDAACAAALALGVCEPQASGLGGQTMALIHVNGRSTALDGSGRAPARLRPEEMSEQDRDLGYRATTAPTTPAVLGRMHELFGRLSWSRVVEPAVDLAGQGYPISRLQHDLAQDRLDEFEAVPSRSGARYFLGPDGQALPVGFVFKQPELADLLRLIAKEGAEVFYRGEPARMIEADMKANGGYLRADDLANLALPRERPVIESTFRGLPIVTMPPPCAGRSLLLALRVLDRQDPGFTASGSPEAAVFLANLIREILSERQANVIHPDRYDPTVDPALHGNDLVTALSGPARPESGGLTFKGGETTHLSVMDADGGAVGLTQSINAVYGPKAAAEGLGFLYNNYLVDSVIDQPDHPHYLGPGGISWSSMAPLIAFRQGRPWLVAGSPGSERILSAIIQFVIHLIDGKASMCKAMDRPRLHCGSDGEVSIEADGFEAGIVERLTEAFPKLTKKKRYSFFTGAVHAVLNRLDGNGFQGVAEVRRDGAAVGPDCILNKQITC